MMIEKNKNSGQAITEFLALVLSFCICFLGLLLIMGISIANIEVFNDAKFNADEKAQFADFGNEGDNIATWKYTWFELIKEYIPFLPFDKPSNKVDELTSFKEQFKNPVYSQPDGKYEFNDYTKIEPKIALHFPEEMPANYREAANLIRGTTSNFTENERVFTISDRKYFERQKTYEAFRIILGTDLNKSFNLENNRSNTVYMPAMKVLEK